jgi:tetratricopeptide (TPR) repeat protein
MGLEREAVTFYQRAIDAGLSGADLAGALLGLGSTLRGLGQYAAALECLERGVKSFPENRAIQVFHAMALYNSGRPKESVSTLLRLLAETSSDTEIIGFKRAILLYSDDLDRVWD